MLAFNMLALVTRYTPTVGVEFYKAELVLQHALAQGGAHVSLQVGFGLRAHEGHLQITVLEYRMHMPAVPQTNG